MSLARGRITGPSEACRAGQDRDESGIRRASVARSAPSTVAPRVALAVALTASLLAVVLAGRADGAGQSWSVYLAPASACPGAGDAAAPRAVQERAVACLLNWARVRAHLARLARRSPLRVAAVLKGRKVASCRDFSHTPCGVDPRAPLDGTGYRYATFGENLLLGTWGRVTPRHAVSLWLQSPGHRANILRPGFRHIGAALVRAQGMRQEGDAALWVTAFATPR